MRARRSAPDALAAADARARLGRPRHDRAPRRHRRDGDGDGHRRWRSAPRALNADRRACRFGRRRDVSSASCAPGGCRARTCSPGGSGSAAEEQAVLVEARSDRARRMGHRDARGVARQRPAHGDVGARPRRARRRRRTAARHGSPRPRRLARDPRPPLRLHDRGSGAHRPAPSASSSPCPSGAPWTYGPEAAPNRITGDAAEYCRVFVQRLPRAQAVTLVADGAGADAALDVARAYL